MNGRPYTQQEIQYLVKHYAFAGAQACAEALGRSVWSIKTAVCNHKEIPRPNKMWTKADLDILREHYPRKGRKAVAAMVGATYRSVGMQAQRMGLKYIGPDKLTKRRCKCCGVWKPLELFTPTGRECATCKATPAPQAAPGSSRKWRREVAKQRQAA